MATNIATGVVVTVTQDELKGGIQNRIALHTRLIDERRVALQGRPARSGEISGISDQIRRLEHEQALLQFILTHLTKAVYELDEYDLSRYVMPAFEGDD